MSNSQNLVVSLRPPANVALEDAPAEATGLHGHPDWLGLPDALYDEDRMVLVGLVFPIVGSEETIRAVVANLDPKVARVCDATDAFSRELYFGDDDEHWLEIRWAFASKNGYLPAQIADVDFDFESDDVLDQMPIRMKLHDCKNVAAELGLTMPAIVSSDSQ